MTTAAAPATNKLQNTASRDALILEHLSLVNMIATHVQRSIPVHVELDDLTHAGMLGLIDAAEKYQAGKEVAFAAYAKHRIRGAILDSMRRSDWASRDLRKRYKQVEAARQTLAQTLGREATDEEVASELKIESERWKDLMVDFRNISAAAQTRRERDDERPSQDVPCSVTECPDQVYAQREMRKKLKQVMKSLPQRYQQVLDAYYHREMTMREIGEELGIRESRVSQIHKAALAAMQQELNQTGISEVAALAA